MNWKVGLGRDSKVLGLVGTRLVPVGQKGRDPGTRSSSETSLSVLRVSFSGSNLADRAEG